MNKTELTSIFEPLFENYNEQLANNLKILYPLDSDTDTTFNEANFTSNFIKSLYLNQVSSNLATWDEFPVPKGMRIEKPSKAGMIDSLIIDHEHKRIYLLEAKRLRQLNSKHPYETVSDIKDNPASLISDMARVYQVANSDILPRRIWKADRIFEPLGAEYADYRIFGLALCGIWTKDHPYDEIRIEEVFVTSGNSLINQNPAFGAISLQNGVTLVEEIRGVSPPKVSKKWQFFTLLHVWEIERPNYNYSRNLERPEDNRNIKDRKLEILYQMILSLGNVLGPSNLKSNTVNLRLKPACLSQTLKDHSIKNDDFYIWIPFEQSKIVVLCGLSSRERNSSLDMPDGWEKDTRHIYDDDSYKNNYVYELGDWSDLDSAEGRNNIQSRIKGLSETLQDIRLV